jgi:UTP--glucose-1-phosphate uridylyltransferase
MNSKPKIRKAVIAAAGFGTRFLPQTKAMPKEMMPIIDKPIIQYVVEELVEAGIEDIIIVGSSNKRSIEDHFDEPNADLLANLRAGGEKKAPLIDMLGEVANMANFVYVRQKGPYGNATPILCAAHLLDDDEPFIYTFADDFFVATPSRTEQLIETHKAHGGSVYACKVVADDSEYDRYGFVQGDAVDDNVMAVRKIVEKPGKANAPSDLASVSSYLITPEFLPYLQQASSEFDGAGEFTFQPVMQKMMNEGHQFFARKITGGHYYDTGDKLEYLKTVVDFALARDDIKDEFAAFLRSRM